MKINKYIYLNLFSLAMGFGIEMFAAGPNGNSELMLINKTESELVIEYQDKSISYKEDLSCVVGAEAGSVLGKISNITKVSIRPHNLLGMVYAKSIDLEPYYKLAQENANKNIAIEITLEKGSLPGTTRYKATPLVVDALSEAKMLPATNDPYGAFPLVCKLFDLKRRMSLQSNTVDTAIAPHLILGLFNNASQLSIKTAYEKLKAEWNLGKYPNADQKLKALIIRINMLIDNAYAQINKTAQNSNK